MKNRLKIADGDELLVGLDRKAKSRWRGHLYDLCCNCGFRHHTIYEVEIRRSRPILSLEIYSDFYGSKFKQRAK